MKQWNYIFKEVIKQKDKALHKENSKCLASQNTYVLKLLYHHF